MRLIDDPAAIHRNRELLHAPWCTVPTPWTQSLDGVWAFHLAPRPEAVPAGCEQPAFDDRAWARIPYGAKTQPDGKNDRH